MKTPLDKKAAIGLLNKAMEMELAGVVRYTHYALMVFGYHRIPIVGWLEAQAEEGLAHARRAGDLVTWLGGQPSLGIGPLLKTHRSDIGDILREALEHEGSALAIYRQIHEVAHDKDVRLEDYAREMIATEVADCDKIDKMLRKPVAPATLT